MQLYDDPDLFDALMPAGAAQVAYYTALAQRASGPVLALACGSGQLLAPIAATGATAVGLDV